MRRTVRRVSKSLINAAYTALIFTALSFPPGILFAQGAPAPKIAIEPEVYDFGSVTEGAKVEHEFTVVNRGEADLTIQKVVAACGCTATSASSEKIAAGQNAKIKVAFDSSGFAGPQVKIVRIMSNDSENPVKVATLKGTVESLVSVEPASITIESVAKPAGTQENGLQEKNVKIRVKAQEDIRITSVSSASKYLVLKEIQGGDKSRELSVSLSPDAPVGELRDRIVVGLEGSGRSGLSIPVFASVKTPLRLNPPSVSFGVIAGTEPLVRRVKIENSGTQPFRPKSAESSDPALKADITTIEDGRSYWINVTLDPAKVTRDLKASLTVRSDGSPVQTVSLNVYGVLAPSY